MEINEVDISKYLKIQEFPLKKHKMDIHKGIHITMSDLKYIYICLQNLSEKNTFT